MTFSTHRRHNASRALVPSTCLPRSFPPNSFNANDLHGDMEQAKSRGLLSGHLNYGTCVHI